MPHEWSHGHFYWNELMTRDAGRRRSSTAPPSDGAFDPMPMPDGTYWVAKMGGEYVGGLFPLTSPQFDGVPESWMSYLAVDDVDARVKKAQSSRRNTDAADLRCPRGRSHRDFKEPGGAGVGWMTPQRRDHAEVSPCNTRSFHRMNGWLRARRCLPRKRNSPEPATS